jgi:alpha-amylase
VCEQRWPTIKNMVGFRRVVEGTKLENWSDDGYNQMTFCRGNKGFIAFNADQGVGFNATVNTCMPAGTYCDIISGKVEDYECTGVTVVVDEDSKANVVIPHDDPHGVIAIHVEEKID